MEVKFDGLWGIFSVFICDVIKIDKFFGILRDVFGEFLNDDE